MTSKYKNCPYCYYDKIHTEALKCKKCGEWLDKKALSQSRDNKNIGFFILAGIFLFGVISIILVLLLTRDSGKDPSTIKKLEGTEGPEITYECYVKNKSLLKEFVERFC